MKNLQITLLRITLFGIAMAFLESAVVIYLREISYPDGFRFPLAPVPPGLALTEVLREAATILMLLGVAAISGNTFSRRFAWFIYTFAIWDIFYYIFLKILTGWPESLMTWDVLFLIPATWTGPVICPVIISLSMIAFSFVILVFAEKNFDTRIIPMEWILLILGSLILITAFILDYLSFILRHFNFADLWKVAERERIFQTAMDYVPARFPWGLFLAGELIIILIIILYYRRIKNIARSQKSSGSVRSS